MTSSAPSLRFMPSSISVTSDSIAPARWLRIAPFGLPGRAGRVHQHPRIVGRDGDVRLGVSCGCDQVFVGRVTRRAPSRAEPRFAASREQTDPVRCPPLRQASSSWTMKAAASESSTMYRILRPHEPEIQGHRHESRLGRRRRRSPPIRSHCRRGPRPDRPLSDRVPAARSPAGAHVRSTGERSCCVRGRERRSVPGRGGRALRASGRG